MNIYISKYKLLKKCTTLLILLTGIIIFSSQISLGFGVKPLTIDLDLSPGQEESFTLELLPGSKEEIVNISLYYPIQNPSGELTYREGNSEEYPAIEWVSLEQEQVSSYPDRQTEVTGKVQVPYDTGGSHTVILMVEPQLPDKNNVGISFMVRYAVRLNIRVDRPGLRRTSELVAYDLVANEQGQPFIKALFKNTSQWDYKVSGEATIRDSNRRLVERISLITPTGAQSNLKETRIYPQSQVEYLGEVTRRLAPGEYDLRVFFRYGENGQIIKNKKIVVNEGDFNFARADEIGAFTVDTERVELELKAGERKTIPLKLQSEIAEDSIIVIEGKDIENEYKYSNLEWLKVINNEQIILRSRMSTRVVVSTIVPRDVEDGSYNSIMLLKAFNPVTNELLEVEEIPFSVLVGNEHNPDVELRSTVSNKAKEGYLISLDLVNSGNISIKPRADIIIKNENDEFVNRVELVMSEEEEMVIPLMPEQLAGIVHGLDTGNYKLEITIFNENQEINRFEENIVIN